MQFGTAALSAVAANTAAPRDHNVDKRRLLIVIAFLLWSFLLTYIFHVVLNLGILFTHFFYIPIVLSACWWKRKGLVVAIVLALYLIFSHQCCLIEGATTYDDYLRSIIFVVTALIVAMLSERIETVEDQVRKSEARYRSMFEHMSDGVALFGAVEDGADFVFLDVNQAAERIDGRSRKQLMGKRLREMSPRDHGLVSILRRVWETGGAETWTDGFPGKTRMGGWHENSAYKLPSGEVVVICSDRTEQKQAEQKAFQLASLVESSDAAIISMSPDGEILSWNSGATKVYGYEPEEMLGDCILTLVPSDHWETMLQRIDDMKNGEKRDHYETVHVNKDGRQIDMSIIMSPLKDLQGNVLGASFIGRNIMRRKEAERGLQRAYEQLERKVEERTAELATANEELRKEIAERARVEKALKESSEKIKLFAYLICHDLKSPSIGIYGLARLLRNQYGDILDEKGKTYCEQILKASEQVGALVEKINTYISTKESTLNIERVELKEIFETIRAEFAVQLSSRNIELTAPDAPAQVYADPLSLLRVIRNLVDNALKYGGDQLSEIRLGYEESDPFHILSVHDDGVGIKSEDTEKIFGLFQRSPTVNGVEGSGLGLAIVKEAAERHGGRVWVESEPGRGTTFFVSISKILD